MLCLKSWLPAPIMGKRASLLLSGMSSAAHWQRCDQESKSWSLQISQISSLVPRPQSFTAYDFKWTPSSVRWRSANDERRSATQPGRNNQMGAYSNWKKNFYSYLAGKFARSFSENYREGEWPVWDHHHPLHRTRWVRGVIGENGWSRRKITGCWHTTQ